VMLKPEQVQAYRKTLRDPEIFKQLQEELLRVSCELKTTRIGNSASK